jgi:hypothetical protein
LFFLQDSLRTSAVNFLTAEDAEKRRGLVAAKGRAGVRALGQRFTTSSSKRISFPRAIAFRYCSQNLRMNRSEGKR